MLTRSPWAKEAAVSYNGGPSGFGGGDSTTGRRRGGGGGIGGGGIGGGGIGGGGIGGGGIGGSIPGIGGIGGQRRGPGTGQGGPVGSGPSGNDPGGASRQQFHATIRWESARPIQEALRIGSNEQGTNPDFEKYYVVNMLGDLPMMGRDRSSNDDDDPALKERRIEMLKEYTRLDRKDGPLFLEKIEQGSRIGRQGPGTLSYFSRLDGISLDDKQLSFYTKMGPLEIKARFTVKDMLYRGKLAV